MLKYRIAVLVFAGIVCTIVSWPAAKDATVDPKTLISHALQREELWSEGTPPLQLRGEVRIWDSNGGMAKGEYTYDWNSPSRWREHIRFVNYERIRVGDSSGFWQKRELDYEPEMIFKLERVLDLTDALKIGSKQTLGKLKAHEENGVQQQCTEVKWSTAVERSICFDEAAGTVANIEYRKLDCQHQPEVTRLEYDKFAPVGEKLVPHEVRALQGTKMVASLDILELTEKPEADPALFNPPENSVHWATCKEVQGRELITAPAPEYSANVQAKMEQGLVIAYVVIEADGTLSHSKLIHAATPTINAATLAVLGQWRYKPAACGNLPVRTETALPFDFWLGD